MDGSIALVQLTELKHQRMKQCAEFRQRSRWQPPYALPRPWSFRRLKYRACQKDAPC